MLLLFLCEFLLRLAVIREGFVIFWHRATTSGERARTSGETLDSDK